MSAGEDSEHHDGPHERDDVEAVMSDAEKDDLSDVQTSNTIFELVQHLPSLKDGQDLLVHGLSQAERQLIIRPPPGLDTLNGEINRWGPPLVEPSYAATFSDHTKDVRGPADGVSKGQVWPNAPTTLRADAAPFQTMALSGPLYVDVNSGMAERGLSCNGQAYWLAAELAGSEVVERLPSKAVEVVQKLVGPPKDTQPIKQSSSKKPPVPGAEAIIKGTVDIIESPAVDATFCLLSSMQYILDSMRRSDDVAVQVRGCKLLTDALRQGSAAARANLASELKGFDGVACVLRIFRTQAHSAETVKEALKVLALFANTEGMIAKLDDEDYKVVLDVLRDHIKSVRLQGYGLLAVGALSKTNLGSAQQFFLHGAVEVAISAMCTHATNGFVQTSGCQALGSLAMMGRNARKTIVDLGGTKAILDATRQQPLNLEVSISSSFALQKLASDTEHLDSLVRNDGVELLLRAMRDHPTSVEVQGRCCRVLRSLAGWNEDVAKQILDQGGLDVILVAEQGGLKSTHSTRVSRLALEALAALGPVIIKELQGGEASRDLCVLGCHALGLLLRRYSNPGTSIAKGLEGAEVAALRAWAQWPWDAEVKAAGVAVLEILGHGNLQGRV